MSKIAYTCGSSESENPYTRILYGRVFRTFPSAESLIFPSYTPGFAPLGVLNVR